MEKCLDITKPLYREQILPVPGHFVLSRFHCIIIGMQGKKGCGLVQNRVEKSEDFCLEYGTIMKNWSPLPWMIRIPVNLVNLG